MDSLAGRNVLGLGAAAVATIQAIVSLRCEAEASLGAGSILARDVELNVVIIDLAGWVVVGLMDAHLRNLERSIVLCQRDNGASEQGGDGWLHGRGMPAETRSQWQ